jgi:hypothetical protein
MVYRVEYSLESVSPDVFWTLQHELAGDAERQGIFHRFDSGGRLALGSLSYVHVESRLRTSLVQAFHTFPDYSAIVKTQSLFELPASVRG